MPKGQGRKDTTRIVELSRQYMHDIEDYRRLAEARRNATVYTQEMLGTLHEKAMQFFNECAEEGKPPTVGMLCIKLNIGRMILHRAKNGEYDYRLMQYCDLHGVCEADVLTKEDALFNGINPLNYYIDAEGNEVILMAYSEVAWKWLEYIEACTEENIVKGTRPIGSIFYAKSVFGFSDSPDLAQVSTVPRVADRADAEKLTEDAVNELAYQKLVSAMEGDAIEKRTEELKRK